MLAHIRELERVLGNVLSCISMDDKIQTLQRRPRTDHGVEVRPWQNPEYHTTYPLDVTADAMGNLVQDTSSGYCWQRIGLVWVKIPQDVTVAAFLPQPRGSS